MAEHIECKERNLFDAGSLDRKLSFYRDMFLVRRFEERAAQLYGMGLIGGFCHLYIGQEAVVIGSLGAILTKDQVITTYRDHGHMLARGMDPKGVMAELTGRSDGHSKGKGGSMHMFSREKNFFGGHGIVGAGVPIGTGLAFANRYREEDSICLTFYGDGAANQGQVYESFNMAALWKLPILYIIENNRYAMGTSIVRATTSLDLFKRGSCFGIPGEKINGMILPDVYQAVAEAAAFVRAGGGPFILEMDTYRYKGHSMSDPGTYRTREEVQSVKTATDPIVLYRKFLTNIGVDKKTFSTIEKEVKEIVASAVLFSKESPEPCESELWIDVVL